MRDLLYQEARLLVEACIDEREEPLTSNRIWDSIDLYQHFNLLGLTEEEIGMPKTAVLDLIHARVEEALRPLSTPGASQYEVGRAVYSYRSNISWLLGEAGLTMSDIGIDQGAVEALVVRAEESMSRKA